MAVDSYPFSDDDMEYDFKSHNYILTVKCVSKELGIDLSIDGNVTGSSNQSGNAYRILRKVSRFAYDYIYSRVQDGGLWQKLLAKTPSVRSMLKEMMLEQLDAVHIGAVDIYKGEAAYQLQQIALRTVCEWGVCLIYAGRLNIGHAPYLDGEY